VVSSGDLAFAQQKWTRVEGLPVLAFHYDEQGLPRNFGVGHGWVEGGPLLRCILSFIRAVWARRHCGRSPSLANLAGKEDVSKKLGEDFSHQQQLVNKTFWSAEKNRFAFALDRQSQQVDEPSVLASVPMWFGLLDADKAGAMIAELAAPEHEADWGMRIISSSAAKYNAGGYHLARSGHSSPDGRRSANTATIATYGLFNLMATPNWPWTDRSARHGSPVGRLLQPISTSSPHQIWSAAMS